MRPYPVRMTSSTRPCFRLARQTCCLLFLLITASSASGQVDFGFGGGQRDEPAFNDSRDEVRVTLLPSSTEVPAGGDVIIAVVLDASPGWHLWPGPGKIEAPYATFESAIRTEISVPDSNDEAITLHLGFANWPTIHGVEADLGDGPMNYGVYEGRVGILIPATIAADASGGPREIAVDISFQACDDQFCLAPAFETVRTEINVLSAGTVSSGTDTASDPVFSSFDSAVFGEIRGGAVARDVVDFDVFGATFSIDANGTGGFMLMLLVAATGGMLLNFTPCVLPVIPLKIMGLSAVADNRRRCLALGAAMSVGVVFFWMVLGGLIAGLKSFQSISEFFQYPFFTISVGCIIAIMAVGMAGFFTIRLPSKVYSVQTSHDTIGGSFVFGIMTAILSTPCTAPLMGAAAAWATTQSPATVLAVFGAIGVGMAIPYLVLSAFPDLVKKMPRTGASSEVVKQVMGLLLLAAGIYFIGSGVSGLTVVPGEPPSRLYWWFVAIAGAAAGIWLVVRTLQLSSSLWPRIVFGFTGVSIVAASTWVGLTMTAKGPIDWIYYTPDRFAAAIEEQQVVVLDFTAEWCLNCKTLEATVLQTPGVVTALDRTDVVPMKIDLTGENPDGIAKRNEAGRLTIPLLVVYGRDGAEIWKSDAYTPGQVIEAIVDGDRTYGRVSEDTPPAE